MDEAGTFLCIENPPLSLRVFFIVQVFDFLNIKLVFKGFLIDKERGDKYIKEKS